MKKNIIFFLFFTAFFSCNQVVNNIEENKHDIICDSEELKGLSFLDGIREVLDENSIKHLDTINEVTSYQVKWVVDSILILEDSTKGLKKPMRFFKKRMGFLRKVGLLDVSDLGIQNLKQFVSRNFNNTTHEDEILKSLDTTLGLYFSYSNYKRVTTESELIDYLGSVELKNHKHLLRLIKRDDFYLFTKDNEHKDIVAVVVNVHLMPTSKIMNLGDLFEWVFVDINLNESDIILDKLFL